MPPKRHPAFFPPREPDTPTPAPRRSSRKRTASPSHDDEASRPAGEMARKVTAKGGRQIRASSANADAGATSKQSTARPPAKKQPATAKKRALSEDAPAVTRWSKRLRSASPAKASLPVVVEEVKQPKKKTTVKRGASVPPSPLASFPASHAVEKNGKVSTPQRSPTPASPTPRVKVEAIAPSETIVISLNRPSPEIRFSPTINANGLRNCYLDLTEAFSSPEGSLGSISPTPERELASIAEVQESSSKSALKTVEELPEPIRTSAQGHSATTPQQHSQVVFAQNAGSSISANSPKFRTREIVDSLTSSDAVTVEVANTALQQALDWMQGQDPRETPTVLYSNLHLIETLLLPSLHQRRFDIAWSVDLYRQVQVALSRAKEAVEQILRDIEQQRRASGPGSDDRRSSSPALPRASKSVSPSARSSRHRSIDDYIIHTGLAAKRKSPPHNANDEPVVTERARQAYAPSSSSVGLEPMSAKKAGKQRATTSPDLPPSAAFHTPQNLHPIDETVSFEAIPGKVFASVERDDIQTGTPDYSSPSSTGSSACKSCSRTPSPMPRRQGSEPTSPARRLSTRSHSRLVKQRTDDLVEWLALTDNLFAFVYLQGLLDILPALYQPFHRRSLASSIEGDAVMGWIGGEGVDRNAIFTFENAHNPTMMAPHLQQRIALLMDFSQRYRHPYVSRPATYFTPGIDQHPIPKPSDSASDDLHRRVKGHLKAATSMIQALTSRNIGFIQHPSELSYHHNLEHPGRHLPYAGAYLSLRPGTITEPSLQQHLYTLSKESRYVPFGSVMPRMEDDNVAAHVARWGYLTAKYGRDIARIGESGFAEVLRLASERAAGGEEQGGAEGMQRQGGRGSERRPRRRSVRRRSSASITSPSSFTSSFTSASADSSPLSAASPRTPLSRSQHRPPAVGSVSPPSPLRRRVAVTTRRPLVNAEGETHFSESEALFWAGETRIASHEMSETIKRDLAAEDEDNDEQQSAATGAEQPRQQHHHHHHHHHQQQQQQHPSSTSAGVQQPSLVQRIINAIGLGSGAAPLSPDAGPADDVDRRGIQRATPPSRRAWYSSLALPMVTRPSYLVTVEADGRVGRWAIAGVKRKGREDDKIKIEGRSVRSREV